MPLLGRWAGATCLNGFFSARTARLNLSIPKLATLGWQATSTRRNPKSRLPGLSVFARVAGTRLSTFAPTSDIGPTKAPSSTTGTFPRNRLNSGKLPVRVRFVAYAARLEEVTVPGRNTAHWALDRGHLFFWSILRFSFERFCYESCRKNCSLWNIFGNFPVRVGAEQPFASGANAAQADRCMEVLRNLPAAYLRCHVCPSCPPRDCYAGRTTGVADECFGAGTGQGLATAWLRPR